MADDFNAPLEEMKEYTTMFQTFISHTVFELKELLINATHRDEVLFYQRLISLKLSLAQEKVVGKELL